MIGSFSVCANDRAKREAALLIKKVSGNFMTAQSLFSVTLGRRLSWKALDLVMFNTNLN